MKVGEYIEITKKDVTKFVRLFVTATLIVIILSLNIVPVTIYGSDNLDWGKTTGFDLIFNHDCPWIGEAVVYNTTTNTYQKAKFTNVLLCNEEKITLRYFSWNGKKK